MTIRISIVVPFYNAEPYIERCVRSLLDQSYDRNKYEIIFIDNASTDKSAEIVRRYSDIILLHEKERSRAKTRNQGVRYSSGEIVAFIDADCAAEKTWLESIDRIFSANKDADIVLGGFRPPAGSSHLLRFMEDYEMFKVRFFLENKLSRYVFGFGGNMAIKRIVFTKIGLFLDIFRGSDAEIVRRYLSKHGTEGIFCLSDERVALLDITNIVQFFKKSFLYGSHISTFKKLTRFEDPGLRLSWEIFNRCSKKNKYDLGAKLSLLFVLFIGKLAFKCGELSSHLFRAPVA